MAIPSSYTESALRDYMVTVTANVAGAIGWTATEFTEPVNDVLVAYGVDNITDATDIAKLRSLARVEAWRAVAGATVADYNFSADGGSYSRNQLHEQAVKALERAESEASANGYAATGAMTIDLGGLKYQDPYLTDESLFE